MGFLNPGVMKLEPTLRQFHLRFQSKNQKTNPTKTDLWFALAVICGALPTLLASVLQHIISNYSLALTMTLKKNLISKL